jgi:transcriptional regulator with XRE-family HTH domain
MRRTERWRQLCVDFGALLRRIREERDISSAELAAAIGANSMTVMSWERGRTVPTVPTLMAIATALSCPLADLLPEQTRHP